MLVNLILFVSVVSLVALAVRLYKSEQKVEALKAFVVDHNQALRISTNQVELIRSQLRDLQKEFGSYVRSHP